MSTTTELRAFPAWLLIAMPCVLAWRIAALVWPSPFVRIDPQVAFPTALMGLMFLAAGVITFNRAPSRAVTVFALFCVASAIHWGGAIGLPPRSLELAFLGVYLSLTLVADAAFLHLALIYPQGRVAAHFKVLLYLPALIGLLVAPLVPVVGTPLLMLGMGLSLAGFAVFAIRTIWASPDQRRASGLPLIVGATLVGGGLQVLGSSGYLPGLPDAWNLVLSVVPVSIAVALMNQGPEADSKGAEA